MWYIYIAIGHHKFLTSHPLLGSESSWMEVNSVTILLFNQSYQSVFFLGFQFECDLIIYKDHGALSRQKH